jgi:hypothetical protein
VALIENAVSKLQIDWDQETFIPANDLLDLKRELELLDNNRHSRVNLLAKVRDFLRRTRGSSHFIDVVRRSCRNEKKSLGLLKIRPIATPITSP